MKHLRGIALLVLCAVAIQATAIPPGQVFVYGSGSLSCGKWLASNVVDRHNKLNWVLGWLSAAGYYTVLGELRETDSDAVAAWVDNYCHNSPLNTISNAAAALVDTLAKSNSKP